MQPALQDCFDIRTGRATLPGACTYIQSGDPTDFDGYYCAAAGEVLARRTKDCRFVLVMPERRACNNLSEPDPMTHVPVFSEEVLSTVGSLVRHLCPHGSTLVRGPLNERAMIPIKFAFNEPLKYGSLLKARQPRDAKYSGMQDLAEIVCSSSSVTVDVLGSLGFLVPLAQMVGEEVLGKKLKSSGMPVVVMAGVFAEVKTTTLPLPGRDPRATFNCLYSPKGMEVLLRMAKAHSIPLLFITNNVCNTLCKYEDAQDVIQKLSLQGMGLLEELANAWYGMSHLKGKCVPFDWVALCALLLHGRRPDLLKVSRKEMYVGVNDPAILVLKNPGVAPDSPDATTASVMADNLRDTQLWGVVENVDGLTGSTLTDLAQALRPLLPVV